MRMKDNRLQIYYRETESVAGSTVESSYRHFIYSKKLFREGGLYYSAMGLKMEDAVNSGLSVDTIPVRFTVNRNIKITTKCKVICDGKVYDIKYIDPFDFRSKQMTFVALESPDKTKYAGDRFEGEDDELSD